MLSSFLAPTEDRCSCSPHDIVGAMINTPTSCIRLPDHSPNQLPPTTIKPAEDVQAEADCSLTIESYLEAVLL